jgi:hypothetical protein
MSRQVSVHPIFRMERTVQHVSGDSVVRAFMRSFSLSLCMRARKVFVSVFFILSFYPKLMFYLRIFPLSKKQFQVVFFIGCRTKA